MRLRTMYLRASLQQANWNSITMLITAQMSCNMFEPWHVIDTAPISNSFNETQLSENVCFESYFYHDVFVWWKFSVFETKYV